jgi:hypothetical protein
VLMGLDVDDIVVDFSNGVAIGNVRANIIDLEDATEKMKDAPADAGCWAKDGGMGCVS